MRFPTEDINIPQVNPLLSGFSQGQDVYSKILQSLFAKSDLQNQQAVNQEKLKQLKLTNQYLPNQLSLGLENQMAQNDKLNGLSSAPGRLIQDYQKVINQYGPNSPQAKQFKSLMDTQLSSQGSRDQYYQALTQSLPTRLLPQFNREQALNQLLNQGYSVDEASKIMSGSAGIKSNNPTLASQQYDESQSNLMHQYLPTSAQNSIYAAQTSRPFAEGILEALPKIDEYLKPDSPVRITKQQLESIISGKTPKGLEDLAIFNNNLTAYSSKVADILKTPAFKDERDRINKIFDLKTWYSQPEYSRRVLSDFIYRVNQAELGNTQGLSPVQKNLSVPIGKNGLTVNPSQLSAGTQLHPEIARAAGIIGRTYQGSDGRTYTREELEKIAGGK